MGFSLFLFNDLRSGYYLIALLSAFLVVIVATPIVRAIALRSGKVDLPSARKVHQQPIPRLGGISICAGTVGALLITGLLGISDLLPQEPIAKIVALGLGSICFFLIGLVDDLIGLSPITRLLLQSGVASLVWLMGVRIEFLPLPGLGLTQLGWLSFPLTIIWLTGVVNAINWIDGLDGLASGVSGIAAVILFLICAYTGQLIAALFLVALSGSLLGFLFYNFNPAQIFMGDGGSYFIGFLLAAVGVMSWSASSTVIPIPFLVLAVPIIDMTAVIIVRLWRGCSPFKADQRHLHHRLLKAGLSHRLTVLVIYTLALWSGSLATVSLGIASNSLILVSATGLLGYASWQALQQVTFSSFPPLKSVLQTRLNFTFTLK
jgi:UDP-N-acetylmuramyl pentapeptide phosphotransferase/UDP-N-acetylglucosamine-1-phosphate transferase